jgi:alpha-1,2-mannosyltransferase
MISTVTVRGPSLSAVAVGLQRRSVRLAVLVEVPLLALGYLTVWAATGKSMQDFAWIRAGGLAVLHGHSPYVAPQAVLLAQNDKFVYPAIDAYTFVPFALLPRGVAAVFFLFLSCAAVAVGVQLLGVRDWRCLSVALLSPPLFFALAFGTLEPLLFLGVAAAWHYRQTRWVAVIVGLTCVAKFFLWPLIVWLTATRRLGAAAGAVAVAVVSALAGWAGIGFAGLTSYPTTLRVLDRIAQWRSYSLSGLALALHLPTAAGTVVLAAVAVAGCLLMFRFARLPNGDEQAYIVAILTALLATPLLWNHYLVLLLVPLALARPRLSWAWALPMLLWLTPHPEAGGVAWRAALLLSVTAAVGAVGLKRSVAAAS